MGNPCFFVSTVLLFYFNIAKGLRGIKGATFSGSVNGAVAPHLAMFPINPYATMGGSENKGIEVIPTICINSKYFEMLLSFVIITRFSQWILRAYGVSHLQTKGWQIYEA